MAAWILVPCLVQLRTEFNQLAPGRAKGADGSIGDQAHADRSSDHNPDETGSVPIRDADHLNEVHALDITTDLREPGLTLEACVQHVLGRCRSGAERRLRYIIFNRRIWHVDQGWRQQNYVGSGDPHTGHAHFSASYDTAREADTSPWHLEDLTMPNADEISDKVRADLRNSMDNLSDSERNRLTAVIDAKLAPKLAAIQAGLSTLAGRDFTDEAAIAATVLAGLTPAKLGQAFTAAGITPQAIATMIPDGLAKAVADELAKRLAA